MDDVKDDDPCRGAPDLMAALKASLQPSETPAQLTPGTHDEARVAALREALEVYAALEVEFGGSHARDALRADDEARAGSTFDGSCGHVECHYANRDCRDDEARGATPDPDVRGEAAEWWAEHGANWQHNNSRWGFVATFDRYADLDEDVQREVIAILRSERPSRRGAS